MARPDEMLKTAEFKAHLTQADEYAKANDLPLWPTRIVWVGLIHNISVAKRFAQRRSNYKTSKAWSCFTRLIELGIFSEEPEGIVWEEGSEPWTSDPMLWLDTLIQCADGADPPDLLPRNLNVPS